MGRQTHADATDELTAEQAFERIAERLADDGSSTEVTHEEMLALGVLEETRRGFRTVSAHEPGNPVVAEGHEDCEPVDYYLVHLRDADQTRPGQMWVNIKRVRNCLARDGGHRCVARGAGSIDATGRTLQDGWKEEVDGFDNETLSRFEQVFRQECETCFTFCTEMRRWAFDGTSVFMESSEPWHKWGEKAEHIGVEEEEFWHKIQPAIAKGMPNNPRLLGTSLTPEYAVDVEVGGE